MIGCDNMEIIRLGEFNANVLEKTVNIQPLDCAVNVANNKRNNFACLKRLDYLLEFLEKMYPNELKRYTENLTNRLLMESKKNSPINSSIKIQNLLKEKKHLNNFPNLAKITLIFNLQLLKLPKNVNWQKESIDVKQGDYIRSYLIPNYYYLEILIETLGKEKAIDLFKRYISSFLEKEGSQLPNNFTSITDTFKRIKQSMGSTSDWVMIFGLFSDSKYIFRNDNCLWIDALDDLPDKEIKYFICCYGDYQTAYTGSNGHAILTMEHTIAQGDPYCSRVKHDTRLEWNLEHPEKDAFDKLWSLPNNKGKN